MPARLAEGDREIAAAGVLAPLARSGPSPLLTLTDEEMFVLYGNAGKAQFASPWLDRLAVDRGKAFDAGMLMATARRSMLARGMIAPEVVLAAAEKREVRGDPQLTRANLLITGILTRRNHTVVRLEAFSDSPEERGAHHVFVDHDGTVLHEQTSSRNPGTPRAKTWPPRGKCPWRSSARRSSSWWTRQLRTTLTSAAEGPGITMARGRGSIRWLPLPRPRRGRRAIGWRPIPGGAVRRRSVDR